MFLEKTLSLYLRKSLHPKAIRSRQSPGSHKIKHHPKSSSLILGHVARNFTPIDVRVDVFHELQVTKFLLYCDTVSATWSSLSRFSQKSKNHIVNAFCNAEIICIYR